MVAPEESKKLNGVRGNKYQKTAVRNGQEEIGTGRKGMASVFLAIGANYMKIKFQLPAGTNIYPILL